MNPRRSTRTLALAGVLAIASLASAQQGNPRIGYIYPAGGKLDTQFRVTVGGKNLDGVSGVIVSGKGVRASVLEYARPISPSEYQLLSAKLQDLEAKKRSVSGRSIDGDPDDSMMMMPKGKGTWNATDEKAIADIRRRLAHYRNKPSTPAIAETAVLQVLISADAEPGERELRVLTPNGLSNPMVFFVGQLSEFIEKDRESTETRVDMNVTLPSFINGRIMPGAADRYRFRVGKGTKLTVNVMARKLVPYLPDAVPGWFQAVAVLYDAKGKELSYVDDFRFNPDPVLYYEIPKEGEYVLEIRDSIYRGREDFVYRIAIGELPYVTNIFPLGGKAGTPTTVEVKGWNLPKFKTTMSARGEGLYSVLMRRTEWMPGEELLSGTDVRSGRDLISSREVTSNRVPFMVDNLPECFEKEPNDQPESAQAITLPMIVNGRIDKPGDWDIFKIEGKKGQQIVAEVFARRLDSPLDSMVILTDSAGKQLAFNDDHTDKGAGLTTHHADSYLMHTLPADGTYFVHIGDSQNQGGPEYAYRLRISAPRPDFELRVAPSSINVRSGASTVATVHAMRKDGFADDIVLSLKDAPGFVLSGAKIPVGQEQVKVTITAPPSSSREPFNLTVEGKATIEGKPVVHRAVPADDLMQAFAYYHLVPAKELKVAGGGYSYGRHMTIAGGVPVKIPPGGTGAVRVQVQGASRATAEEIKFELVDPPDGISVKSASPAGDATEMVLQADATKVKPGLKGNLIVNAISEVTVTTGTGDKARTAKRRTPIGVLPAIEFEVP